MTKLNKTPKKTVIKTGKTVGFIARETGIPSADGAKLRELLETLVKHDSSMKIVTGVNNGIELTAAETALGLREDYPGVSVECVISYETVANDWNEVQRDRFFGVMERCDKETVLRTRLSPESETEKDNYISNRSDFLFRLA